MLATAARDVQAFAAESGVRVEVHEARGRLSADLDRMMQVLSNLLNNAIKFSPPGSVVSMSGTPRDGSVALVVRDSGRGIPADKLEAIFERFTQVEAGDQSQKGGAGLGLAICRAIVSRHRGRIWAESVLGHGSSFHVALPAR